MQPGDPTGEQQATPLTLGLIKCAEDIGEARSALDVATLGHEPEQRMPVRKTEARLTNQADGHDVGQDLIGHASLGQSARLGEEEVPEFVCEDERDLPVSVQAVEGAGRISNGTRERDLGGEVSSIVGKDRDAAKPAVNGCHAVAHSLPNPFKRLLVSHANGGSRDHCARSTWSDNASEDEGYGVDSHRGLTIHTKTTWSNVA